MIILRQREYSTKITQAVYKGAQAINNKLPQTIRLSDGKVKRVAIKAAATNKQRLAMDVWNRPGHIVNKAVVGAIENPVKTAAIAGGKVALLPISPALAAVPGGGAVLGAAVGTPIQKGVNKVFPKMQGGLKEVAQQYKDSGFAKRMEAGRSIPEFFRFRRK